MIQKIRDIDLKAVPCPECGRNTNFQFYVYPGFLCVFCYDFILKKRMLAIPYCML